MRARIHLRDRSLADLGIEGSRTWCGMAWIRRGAVVTEDLAAVTCLLCQRKLEDDMAGPEATARSRAADNARSIAYARAGARLRDAHREEFDRYAEEEFPAAFADRLPVFLKVYGAEAVPA